MAANSPKRAREPENAFPPPGNLRATPETRFIGRKTCSRAGKRVSPAWKPARRPGNLFPSPKTRFRAPKQMFAGVATRAQVC